jgi:outer membrane protein TolC
VTRDNQVPVLIQRQSDRQVAFLRLKQLLDIPLDDSLTLTTPIEQAQGPIIPAVEVNGTSLAAALPDTIVGDRAPVRQSEANVRAQEGLLRAARAERFPQIAITSGYQRLYFPTDPFPNLNEYRQNWTVGISAAISLFSGGRIHGDELIARANLDEAQARMQQTRELAALDTRVAYNTYQQAEAAFRASQGTAEQAERAYSIDQIRYREGLSTQTDLSQSRLLLEQAVVNRVSAARDLAIARMRLALLRDLPLQFGGSASAASQARGGATGGLQQQQTQPQQQRATTQSAAASAGGQLGGSSIP